MDRLYTQIVATSLEATLADAEGGYTPTVCRQQLDAVPPAFAHSFGL